MAVNPSHAFWAQGMPLSQQRLDACVPLTPGNVLVYDGCPCGCWVCAYFLLTEVMALWDNPDLPVHQVRHRRGLTRYMEYFIAIPARFPVAVIEFSQHKQLKNKS